MKDCKTVALIVMSLLISGVFWSTGDSYSQLPDPHGIKIVIPSKGQDVFINKDFSAKGASTDNSATDCKVSLLLNGITPYVEASPVGEGGANDFSDWEGILDASHLNKGENKLTAKLLCIDDKNNQITKYHSINFTGTTEVSNSAQTGENLSTTDSAESIEGESSSSVLQSGASEDHVDGEITYGPVIIPPNEGEGNSMIDSPLDNDSVLIPNATSSGSGTISNNGTSMPITSNESKDAPQINSLTGNDTASNNDTSESVIIPPSNNGSSVSNSLTGNGPSLNEPEVGVEQSTGVVESNDIPLILPTPSPRVTSPEESTDDSPVDSPVQESSAMANVENNNNTDLVNDVPNLRLNTSSNAINLTISEPPNEPTTSNFLTPGDKNGTSVRSVAGTDQIINEGMQVILSGDTAYANDSQLSYEWRQVGGDLKVFLGQQNAKEISFWAPEVDKDSKLTFRFIVLAAGTQISSDDVDVTIKDTSGDDNNDNKDNNDDDD